MAKARRETITTIQAPVGVLGKKYERIVPERTTKILKKTLQRNTLLRSFFSITRAIVVGVMSRADIITTPTACKPVTMVRILIKVTTAEVTCGLIPIL